MVNKLGGYGGGGGDARGAVSVTGEVYFIWKRITRFGTKIRALATTWAITDVATERPRIRYAMQSKI